MKKIKIDDATNEQLDYAVAVAQGWKKREFKSPAPTWSENGIPRCWDEYEPTTDQAQGGELIDKFDIGTKPKIGRGKKWVAEIISTSWIEAEDDFRLVASVKAYLLSVYPDGLIEAPE